VEITPVSIANIGYKTYIYFAGMFSLANSLFEHPLTKFLVFNFCFLPLIFFFYPETRNLTLEQIDRLFTGDKVQLYWDSSMGIAGDVDTRVGNATTKDLENVQAVHIE
jgi:hypothetical protein